MFPRLRATVRMLACCAAFACHSWAAASEPVGTTFTYQGQLKQGGDLVDGSADFQFTLFDEAAGGTPVSSTQALNNVTIAEGLFTVELDFGGVFGSNGRWLEVSARSPAGSGTFTVLTPRQRIRPAPAAQFALVSGGVSDGGLPSTYSTAVSLTNPANTYSGSGAGLTGLNASNLNSGTVGSAHLAGTYANALTLSNASNSFTGSGAGLTALNASNLADGTIANARTTGTAANTPNTLVMRDGSGNFAAGTITGTHVGDGAGLTALDAGSINTGTLDEMRLPSSVMDRLPDQVAMPALVGSIGTGANPASIAVHGGFAYVISAGSDLLQVYNVNNSTSPTLVGSVATGDGPGDVAVSGGFACVVCADDEVLQIFNVSNPASPALVGSASTGGTSTSVAVVGSFVYVINYNPSMLLVFNAANPASPALVGSVGTAAGPRSLAAAGGSAYVVSYDTSTLQVFNVSNPTSPALVGSVATGFDPVSIAVAGSIAYVANSGSNTLHAYDVIDSSNPTLIGSIGTANSPSSVAVSGDFVFLFGGGSQLHLFDVSNPTSPTLVGSAGTVNAPKALAAAGGLAYVLTSSSKLQVYQSLQLQFDSVIGSTVGFAGSGAGITALNASNISSGTIGSSLLSGVYSNTLMFNNASNSFLGSFSGLHSGSGASLTSLNASNISSGTINSSLLSGTYSNTLELSNAGNVFAGSGAALTNLNASNISSGSIGSTLLSGIYSNAVSFTNGGNSFAGNGAGLNSLNANLITTGTLQGSRLAGAYSNALNMTNSSNVFAGLGTGLTGLDASNLTTGILPNNRLIGTYTNTVALQNPANQLSGNGAAITSLNASNISAGNLNSARLPSGGTWTLSSPLNFTGPNIGVGIASPLTRLHVNEQTQFATAGRFEAIEGNGLEGWCVNGNVGVGILGVSLGGGRAVVGQASGVGSFGVFAQGNTGATGTKSFQIDHPRDPENAYLLHYSAEGPEPFNLYRGNVVLDGLGEAWVELPDYFEDINRDFHYQLTSIGAPGPNLHVALEIADNTFKIAGGQPGGKVSWTVTAVRDDEYVRHYPTTDVREKPAHLKGTYQHPEVFGQPAEKGESHRRETDPHHQH